jgi:2-methylcitrate dehydratase PrpD
VAARKNGGLIADAVAAFTTGTPFAALPLPIAAKARRHILDTLACGLAGACSAEGRAVRAALATSEPAGPAPIWGTPLALSPRAAALANGTACHAFELDDAGGCDHSGAVVVPAALAALALAERPVDGPTFILAIVLGYEVARRALEACGGYAPHNEAGWHSTATCGTFGAAAATARILGLTETQTRDALGHAASFSGGLWAFIHDGAGTKRVHAGRAAEGGLVAALLARAGLAGPAHVFEDVWGGFTRSFAPATADPGAWTRAFGETWRLERVAIKPHAACRSAHSGIDAVGAVMDGHGLAAADVQSVVVSGPAFLAEMCGTRDIDCRASAQMSLPYGIAVRVVRGDASLEQYRAAVRADPAVRAALDHVRMEVDANLGALDHPTVRLATRDGRVFAERITDPLGSPTNPVPSAAHAAKVTALSGMPLDEAAVRRLCDAFDSLETSGDVRGLPALLAAPRDPDLFD